MAKQHPEPQKLAHSTPKAQAQAPALGASMRLAGAGKAGDETPEDHGPAAVPKHGVHDLRGERVRNAVEGLCVNLRRGFWRDENHALNTRRIFDGYGAQASLTQPVIVYSQNVPQRPVQRAHVTPRCTRS